MLSFKKNRVSGQDWVRVRIRVLVSLLYTQTHTHTHAQTDRRTMVKIGGDLFGTNFKAIQKTERRN